MTTQEASGNDGWLMDEAKLQEELSKIEALFAGAATDGEPVAAGEARRRIQQRLMNRSIAVLAIGVLSSCHREGSVSVRSNPPTVAPVPAPAGSVKLERTAEPFRYSLRWKLQNDTHETIYAKSLSGFRAILKCKVGSAWIRCAESFVHPTDPRASEVYEAAAKLADDTFCEGLIGPQFLAPGKSATITMCGTPHPGALQRVSIEYESQTVPPASGRVTVEFVPAYLPPSESEAVLRAVGDFGTDACSTPSNAIWLASAFAWFGHPSVVPRLIDVRARDILQYFALAHAIATLPDGPSLLVEMNRVRRGDAAVAAGVVLHNRWNCSAAPAACGELLARWARLLASEEDIQEDILDALARWPDIERWPPEMAQVLLGRLRRTTSNEWAIRIAWILSALPETTLKPMLPEVARLLGARARSTRDIAKRDDIEDALERVTAAAKRDPYIFLEPLYRFPSRFSNDWLIHGGLFCFTPDIVRHGCDAVGEYSMRQLFAYGADGVLPISIVATRDEHDL